MTSPLNSRVALVAAKRDTVVKLPAPIISPAHMWGLCWGCYNNYKLKCYHITFNFLWSKYPGQSNIADFSSTFALSIPE